MGRAYIFPMHPIFETAPVVDERDGNGRVQVWRAKPGVYVTRVEGHFSSKLAKAMMAVFNEAPKSERFQSFHEWSPMSDYDMLVPARIVAWAVTMLGRTDRIVVATKKPSIATAVKAAKSTLKIVEMVEGDAAMEAAIGSALR